MGKQVILSFGGNLGEPSKTFSLALASLKAKNILKPRKLSSLYKSRSLLNDEQPDYLNLICLAETELSAEELLTKLQECEKEFGRVQNGFWQARMLDIDIIDYNGEVISSPTLTVPHKEAANRAFVVIPLSEILPDYIHAASGKGIKQLKAELKDAAEALN
jgi:2-amino-4-hydroxy-6-hydroxymethyldihydropteridine diphosphokinase